MRPKETKKQLIRTKIIGMLNASGEPLYYRDIAKRLRISAHLAHYYIAAMRKEGLLESPAVSITQMKKLTGYYQLTQAISIL